MSDHVLVAGQGTAKAAVYHLPAEDAPDRPQCRHGGHENRHYWRRDPERLPDDYRLCRYCDPDTDVDYRNPRHGLRNKLLAMDPDEIDDQTEGSA